MRKLVILALGVLASLALASAAHAAGNPIRGVTASFSPNTAHAATKIDLRLTTRTVEGFVPDPAFSDVITGPKGLVYNGGLSQFAKCSLTDVKPATGRVEPATKCNSARIDDGTIPRSKGGSRTGTLGFLTRGAGTGGTGVQCDEMITPADATTNGRNLNLRIRLYNGGTNRMIARIDHTGIPEIHTAFFVTFSKNVISFALTDELISPFTPVCAPLVDTRVVVPRKTVTFFVGSGRRRHRVTRGLVENGNCPTARGKVTGNYSASNTVKETEGLRNPNGTLVRNETHRTTGTTTARCHK